MKRFFVTLLMVLLIAGCQPAKLSGEGRDPFLASVEEVAYKLPKEERLVFIFLLTKLITEEFVAYAVYNDQYDPYKTFEGKSVGQIIKEGEELLRSRGKYWELVEAYEGDEVRDFKGMVIKMDFFLRAHRAGE